MPRHAAGDRLLISNDIGTSTSFYNNHHHHSLCMLRTRYLFICQCYLILLIQHSTTTRRMEKPDGGRMKQRIYGR